MKNLQNIFIFVFCVMILNLTFSCGTEKNQSNEKIGENLKNEKIDENHDEVCDKQVGALTQNSSTKNFKTLKKGVLTIGTEYGYPPFEYLDRDGKTLIGFDVDLWNELCARLELKPKIFDTQWAGLFSSLETNRFDCVISAVTITKERDEKFLVTKPYIQNSQCYIVRKDFEKKLDFPRAIENLKVAYQAETVSDVFVNKLIDEGVQMQSFEYEKLMDAFDDLKFGRVEVVVAETVMSRILVKENPDIFRIDFVGEPDAFFGILVSRQNPESFEAIQSTIDQMYADGFMKNLEEKWIFDTQDKSEE